MLAMFDHPAAEAAPIRAKQNATDSVPDARTQDAVDASPITGLAANATSPIIATDTGWSAPLSRIGGDDKASVTPTEPAAFGLTIPRGLRPAALTIDHFDMLGPASSLRVQVTLDDTIVGSTEVSGAGALSINLANFIPKSRTGNVKFALRMTPNETTAAGPCSDTILSLAGIRLQLAGTPLPGRTINQVFPSDLERLVLVAPTKDDQARTALARLATAMVHQESPRVAVDVIDEQDVAAFDTAATPWTRIVRVHKSSDPAYFEVTDAIHVTLHGHGPDLVTLAALIGESSLRNADIEKLRTTQTTIPQVARPTGALPVNLFPRAHSTSNGRGEAELSSVLDSAELGLRYGSLQGSVSGFVQLDRPVSGVTVTAQLSGRTLATSQIEGRSGSFNFHFAAHHLESLASHQIMIKATSGERSDDATCPGTLASVQLSVDPGSQVTLVPAEEIPDSISSFPWAAGNQPKVVLAEHDAERLHLVVSELLLMQRNRRTQIYPSIVSKQPASRPKPLIVVTTNKADEATQAPDIPVQPLRLSSQALGGTADASNEFTSVSMGSSTSGTLGDLVISSPLADTAREAGNTLQRLEEAWPGAESFGYLIAADEVQDVPSDAIIRPIELTNSPVAPNELGLSAPVNTASTRNTLIIGLIVGAMAALALRIIVRTHRAATRAIPMEDDEDVPSSD